MEEEEEAGDIGSWSSLRHAADMSCRIIEGEYKEEWKKRSLYMRTNLSHGKVVYNTIENDGGRKEIPLGVKDRSRARKIACSQSRSDRVITIF